MTDTPTVAQLREWSEHVARNPGSSYFYPLAEAYRKRGYGDAARRLCLRGLESHPNHLAAHHLLGLLYRDQGDLERAFDEWDIALRLDPEHHDAQRELGLLCLRREMWDAACRYLEPAAARDPADADVAAALAMARRRRSDSEAGPIGMDAVATPQVESPTADSPTPVRDPSDGCVRLLAGEPGVVGAVLLDTQGLVLAGEMRRGSADLAPEIAATLRGVAEDAEHAVRHLGMEKWNSILLESPEAVVHLTPVSDAILAVATTRDLPVGWALRLAARARREAASLLDPEDS